MDKLDKQKIEFGQIGQNEKFKTSFNRSCIKGLDKLDKMDNISEKVILKFLIFFLVTFIKKSVQSVQSVQTWLWDWDSEFGQNYFKVSKMSKVSKNLIKMSKILLNIIKIKVYS